MNLENISEKYEESLRAFFLDERIIEMIYKEQYGEANYTANSRMYKLQYKDIMNNTAFIPYITIEHLEQFLAIIKIRKGEEYIQRHFKEERNLLVKLEAKRKEIIAEHTAQLMEDIKKIFPDYDSVIPNDLKDMQDVEKMIQSIEEYLKTQKQSLRFKLKCKKIKKFLEKYENELKEKILIETSTYFEHKRNIPSEKYYTSISSDMLKGGAYVKQKIGLDESRNYRYIYLPVMTYHSKEELLRYALHEVMHISKEKISKKTYSSGLFVRKMADDKNKGKLYIEQSLLSRMIEMIQWHIFKKKMNANNISESFGTGASEIEEAFHHWQVRKVANQIITEGLQKKMYMPYLNESVITQQIVYEGTDAITENFMKYFSQDIQEVNNGILDKKSFIKKVGKNNFSLLGSVYETGIQSIIQGKGKSKQVRSKQAGKTIFSNDIAVDDIYVNMGEQIIYDMIEQAKKHENRKSILSKTMNISGLDVVNAGSQLNARMAKKSKERD